MTHSAGDSKYVLLDRDGVINVEASDNGYITTPEALRFVPGSADAIARLNDRGFEVLVCSNQQCVGKGLLALDVLMEISETMRRVLEAESGGRILDFFYCPHLAADGCGCRKPEPGLLIQAQERYGFDLFETFFVGDSYRDIGAAKGARCRSIFVLSGYDSCRHAAQEPLPHTPDRIAPDLAGAVDFILSE